MRCNFTGADRVFWKSSTHCPLIYSLGGIRPKLGPDATGAGASLLVHAGRAGQSRKSCRGLGLARIKEHSRFFVRYGLSAVEGVSQVASVGAM